MRLPLLLWLFFKNVLIDGGLYIIYAGVIVILKSEGKCVEFPKQPIKIDR